MKPANAAHVSQDTLLPFTLQPSPPPTPPSPSPSMYPVSTCVESQVINAENTVEARYRLGPVPNLRDTNLSNSLEQISKP